MLLKLGFLYFLVPFISQASAQFIQETSCEFEGVSYSFTSESVTMKTPNEDLSVRMQVVEIPMVESGSYMPGVTEFRSYSYLLISTREFVIVPKLTKKYSGPIKVYHSKYGTVTCKGNVLYSVSQR